MVDPSWGAEILVVAGLADIVRTTRSERGDPPWINTCRGISVGRRGTLSEKFTESLNSYAATAFIDFRQLAANTGVSLRIADFGMRIENAESAIRNPKSEIDL